MIIWIVEGESGEYADKVEWPVCAHRTLEGAHVKKKMFETWAELHSVEWDSIKSRGLISSTRKDAARKAWHELWPQYPIHLDYTGVRWEVKALEYEDDAQIPGNGA